MLPKETINNGSPEIDAIVETASNDDRDLGEVDPDDIETDPLITESQDIEGSTPNPVGGIEGIFFQIKKNAKVLNACASYSMCSVSMVLVNKSLASSYNHLIDGDLNILLVVIQAFVAVLAVYYSQHMKWIEIPSFSLDIAKQWAPVNIFFCTMLFTGMASLQYNSVPMVTIFKNISNISTAIGDYYFFGNKSEPLVIASFGVMLGGAVFAAWHDISLTLTGLLWMALNCISSSGYVLYMKHATETVDLKKFGMVFYNNVLCVVFLLPVAMFMGQTKIFWESRVLHTADYAMKNLFAGVIGFFLNFASLSCVEAAGPTTFVTIGSLNKIPVAFLGYWIFHSKISKETWFFIAISMCGGFLYSYAKLQSSLLKKNVRSK